MPELPEVETIRRGLDKFILNQTIQEVHILCEKSFRGNKKWLLGQSFADSTREQYVDDGAFTHDWSDDFCG